VASVEQNSTDLANLPLAGDRAAAEVFGNTSFSGG
jgi:hypothetical protein